jgi:hypothetical protein
MNPQSIISEFRILESQGLVRLRALPETESYFDVYGEPDSAQERQQIIDQIERTGCWCVISEFFADGRWHWCDSVGFCTGYENPMNPKENDYVLDLMRLAVRAAESNSVAI